MSGLARCHARAPSTILGGMTPWDPTTIGFDDSVALERGLIVLVGFCWWLFTGRFRGVAQPRFRHSSSDHARR